jgi:cbb3-type cytochrome oxidase subunit 3
MEHTPTWGVLLFSGLLILFIIWILFQSNKY